MTSQSRGEGAEGVEDHPIVVLDHRGLEPARILEARGREVVVAQRLHEARRQGVDLLEGVDHAARIEDVDEAVGVGHEEAAGARESGRGREKTELHVLHVGSARAAEKGDRRLESLWFGLAVLERIYKVIP
jgi:hypothetical protein